MTGSQADSVSAGSELGWRDRVSQFGYELRDYVFPLPTPQTPNERAAAGESRRRIVEFIQKKVDELASAEPFDRRESPGRATHVVASAQKQFEDQHTRIVHVENRIATILGLASLAGIIAFSAMPGFLEGATRLPRWAQIALRLAVGYSLLQLVAIITAAVSGHERQARIAVTLGDMLPSLGETEWATTQRVVEAFRFGAAELGEIGDRKMTCLACAHRAARQLAVALALTAALWILVYPTTSATPKSPDAASRTKVESVSHSQPSVGLPPVVEPRPPVPIPNRQISDSARKSVGRK